jgi:hypothetical protein
MSDKILAAENGLSRMTFKCLTCMAIMPWDRPSTVYKRNWPQKKNVAKMRRLMPRSKGPPGGKKRNAGKRGIY